ncbi:PREDICTED: lymphocyte antigen 6 complex locus protein G6f isoform X4 [Cercocebus atys]|uniref:lymphocyte antigen 6 complex locus protein G6f isoform X4 n=1 Tax=Cercocebus atys TaxID=9531 RepID=UPI0005F56047|nr:PREDICTED: lymphocyte antigen 6 complex locus protein G6f isoform X4 [Cercocebus atys]
MAVLFLLLFLCGTPQAADNIHAIYVALGEAMELPCPSPPTLHGDQHLSWFRSPAAGSFTTLVAQVRVGRPAPDPGKPGRESRLRLLGNYSLWLEGSKEEDAGRYWCAVLGQHHNYQNWRVYDVLVLKASMDASPAFCAPSMGWDMSWILMLLLTMGQGVIILALSIVLWRQRVRGAPVRGNRMRCYNRGGSPSSSCKEAVTTCGEGRPQPGLEQIKLPGNRMSSISLSSHSLSLPPAPRQSFWLPEPSRLSLALGRWCGCQRRAVCTPSGSWHGAPERPTVLVPPPLHLLTLPKESHRPISSQVKSSGPERPKLKPNFKIPALVKDQGGVCVCVCVCVCLSVCVCTYS